MDFDEIPEPSGLEVAAHCPRCGPRALLADKGGAVQENACASCGSSYLAPMGARALLSTYLGLGDDTIAQVTSQSNQSGPPCFSCGQRTLRAPLRGVRMDLCARCGSARLDSAALYTATQGRFGSSAPPPSPEFFPGAVSGASPSAELPSIEIGRPRASSGPQLAIPPGPPRIESRRPMVLDNTQPRQTSTAKVMLESGGEILVGFIGLIKYFRWLIVVVVVIVFGFKIISREYQHMPEDISTVQTPERPAAQSASTPGPAIASASGLPRFDPPRHESARPADSALSTEEMIRDYPFAGHTMSWWAKRMSALKSKTDDDSKRLYALTKRRAIANGLDVDDQGERDVRITPSKDLIARIGNRLGRHDK
jgi:hypothetical protein